MFANQLVKWKLTTTQLEDRNVSRFATSVMYNEIACGPISGPEKVQWESNPGILVLEGKPCTELALVM